ncbi:unnamed protein product [Adineta ricciae]|uniref:Uncharacterized protein n=1 Tax=Adineta ricciae TaxID=249248 RepID=A0A815X1X0_ADIRI|nr:unnamed protein product [Adineta ricciae]
MSDSHRHHLSTHHHRSSSHRTTSSSSHHTASSSSHRSPSHSSRQTNVKSKHNREVHDEYPPFHIPSSTYELRIVNSDTPMDIIDEMLIHVNQVKQYSIDTESEKDNNELCLIQINSMPVESKSMVILIELKNLPSQRSIRYEKIGSLVRLVFRVNNEIYGWGNIRKELEPESELIGRSIHAKLIDIQPHFSTWYNGARAQCWVQSPSYRINITKEGIRIMQQLNQDSSCRCHSPSPYKPNELWSLQNALKYACKLHLDKTYRLSHWSASLTSNRSRLSYTDQRKMVKYAVHDVLAVTFLLRPIMENWTFNMIETRNMKDVFVAFESIELAQLQTTIKKKKKKNIDVQKLARIFAAGDSDIESISSDEEIYLHQITQHDAEPVDENYPPTADGIAQAAADNEDDEKMELELAITTAHGIDDELVGNGHAAANYGDVEGTVDIVQLVPDPTDQQPPQRKKKIRSTEAQKKHNKKRNDHLRLFRYRYVLKRSYYYRFRLKLIRKILRHYGVLFRHVKLHGDQVIIGVKCAQDREQYEDALPSYCFDRKNYWRFKK